MNLIFPADYTRHKYKNAHFSFFLQYAKMAGVSISLSSEIESPLHLNGHFKCIIDNKKIVIDYSDFAKLRDNTDKLPYFKYQKQNINDPVHALGTILVVKSNVADDSCLKKFLRFRENFVYTPGQKILSKQTPRAKALERRTKVQRLLFQKYGKNLDTISNDHQQDFWNAHKNCLASVCVPGATNNMLDRGQYEMLALGVPTVSPQIHTLLPWEQALIPNVHYIKCKDDYSDLTDILDSLHGNNKLLNDISSNSRLLFDEYCTPKKYFEWIFRCLN